MNTEIVDKIIVGRVEPHIYAFETNTVPNYLKIGDTYRPVEERLKEWRHHYEDLVKLYEHVARVDEKYFRDFEVHKFVMEEKKRNRITREAFPNLPYFSNEFFEEAVPSDIDEAIADITDSAEKNDGRYKFYSMQDGRMPEEFHYTRDEEPLTPRPNQADAIDRFENAIKKKRTHLLMYAVMRFGKSFTAMCCAQKMDADLVLVVSAKADVKGEWKKTVEKFKNFEEYLYVSSEDLKANHKLLSEAKKKKQKIVVCLTLQDLSSPEIKERHKQLFKQSVDLLIVDETHFGARAEHYGSVLTKASGDKMLAQEKKHNDESVDDLLEQTRELKSKVQLHLSGTPYRILMGNEFTDEDIISYCQFTDIIEASQKWDEQNLDTKEEWENPYFGFPQMVRFAFNLNASAIKKLEELKQAGISTAFRELFSPLSITKDSEGKHLVFRHEPEVLDFLQVIDGSREDSNVMGFLDNERIKQGDLCHHVVMVLPYRASCDAMETLIKKHKDIFKNLSQYEILNITGVEDGRLYSNLATVKKKIEDCEAKGEKTLTLTVNRMLTGSTVPQWDTMLYLKETESPQEYDQAIFRLQNPYVVTYTDDEGHIAKRNMKPQTLLVDFDPNRMFFLQELRAHIYDINTDSNGNRHLLERIKKELEVSPVIWLNKDKLQEVTPNDILNFIRKYSSERSILDEAKDVPVDLSLLDIDELRDEIMRQQPMGTRGGLKLKPTEEEGEDDIDLDDVDAYPTGDEGSTNPTSDKEKKEDDSLGKRILTLYSRYLFFAFLTKDQVLALQDIMDVIDKGDDNVRIAKHLGISKKMAGLLYKHLNPNSLHELDYKIQNVNDLANDKSKQPIERVENAMRQFGRWSESEVVTPVDKVALRMLRQIPHDRVLADAKFLDIASKEGEFAYAILLEFGDNYKNKIYSIPTSSIAYEFTRKVYEALDMPVENIASDYNSYDLIGEQSDAIINKIKEMGITVAVGNPPYQDEGGSGGTNDAPIFQDFSKVAKSLSNLFSTLIIPSKWFTGGRSNLLDPFRKEMLTCGTVSQLTAFHDASELFPKDVEIKGGVCYYLNDVEHQGECDYSLVKGGKVETEQLNLKDLDVIIREPKLAKLVDKVMRKAREENLGVVESIISSDTPFGIPTNPKTSKKHPFDVSDTQTDEFNVKLFYWDHNVRKTGYVRKMDIRKNSQDVDSIKVLIPKAGGSGNDKIVLGDPILAGASSVCSQTYLYAKFDSEDEAKNFISYLKTRFFRLLVSSMKITQDAMAQVYHFVPMQDFTHSWTDADLFKKYDLSPDEVKYVESMIKPMVDERAEQMELNFVK